MLLHFKIIMTFWGMDYDLHCATHHFGPRFDALAPFGVHTADVACTRTWMLKDTIFPLEYGIVFRENADLFVWLQYSWLIFMWKDVARTRTKEFNPEEDGMHTWALGEVLPRSSRWEHYLLFIMIPLVMNNK